MLYYFIFSAVFSGFLFLIWKTNDWANIVVKGLLLGQLISSLFFIGQTLSYIVKGN
jgi:hypothetical protein